MSDQYYRLVKSWDEKEFPFDTDLDTLSKLNSVMDYQYTFTKMKTSIDTEHVELYEYVGEDLEDGDT